MVLASVILTIKDVGIALSEVGLHYPALRVRCEVSFKGYVLPSGPSPCLRIGVYVAFPRSEYYA